MYMNRMWVYIRTYTSGGHYPAGAGCIYTTSFTYVYMYTPQHGIYKMALISILYYTNHSYFVYSAYMRRKLPLALVLGSYVHGIHCINMIYRDGGGCLYPLYYIDLMFDHLHTCLSL